MNDEPRYTDTPPSRPRRYTGLKVFFLVVLIGGVLFSLLLNGILMIGLVFGGGSRSAKQDLPRDEFPQYEEIWSYGQGEAKVVRIPLQGMIVRQAEGGFLMPALDFTETLLGQIRAASQDEEVKAIIVEIDSPGGMIGPSDEIHQALTRFKQREDKPAVYAFTRDLAASGGYYVAAASDYFMAEPTAVIGSIGVIMQSLNMKGLSEKIGVKDVTIKSGENKDLLNPFRTPDPEQLSLLQEVIDSMHARFRNIVGEWRGLSEEQLAELADGRIFSAQDAVAKNLIDGTGYWDDLLALIETRLGEDLYVVRYRKYESFLDRLAQVQQPDLVRSLRSALSGGQFMYLWQP